MPCNISNILTTTCEGCYFTVLRYLFFYLHVNDDHTKVIYRPSPTDDSFAKSGCKLVTFVVNDHRLNHGLTSH